jgi:predicted XRE-type DNA-binding protein
MSTSKNNARKSSTKRSTKIERSSGNVFRDLGFPAAEAESLLIRCDLMIEIEKIIKERGWTQAKAARMLGIAQPRISELVHGKIERFTVDTLLQYLSMLGKRVTFDIKDSEAA